jgi:hypothetical protein
MKTIPGFIRNHRPMWILSVLVIAVALVVLLRIPFAAAAKNPTTTESKMRGKSKWDTKESIQ